MRENPVKPDIHINEKAKRHLKNWVFRWKTKKAYQHLLQVKKFNRAIASELRTTWLAENKNPIQEISARNIRKVKKELEQRSQLNHDEYGLISADEKRLFNELLRLPWRCQHATNSHEKIKNAGKILAYDELKRDSANFLGLYTNERNIKQLQNQRFVFFRVFVDGANGEKTRYGYAKFITDLSLLSETGWISLHDQESPFGKKSTSRNLFSQKKNVRKASTDKYRTSLHYHYYNEEGKLDQYNTRTASFLDEVFYGADIKPGIALSFIQELVEISKQNPAFVMRFYQQFHDAVAQGETTQFLGDWVREFFRIEGKQPINVHLRFHKDLILSHIPGTSMYKSVLLHKPDIHLEPGEWQKLSELEKTYNAKRNIKRSDANYVHYCQSLVELIAFYTKMHDVEKVLKCVQDYLQLTPHNAETECENGHSFSEGLTILLMNTDLQLCVFIHHIPQENEPVSEDMLDLEYLVSTEYFSLLLNGYLEYKDVHDKSKALLKSLLERLQADTIPLAFIKLPADEIQTVDQYEHEDIIPALADKGLTFDDFVDYALNDPDFADLLNTDYSYLATLEDDIYQMHEFYLEDKETFTAIVYGTVHDLFFETAPQFPPRLIQYMREKNMDIPGHLRQLPQQIRKESRRAAGVPRIPTNTPARMDSADSFVAMYQGAIELAAEQGNLDALEDPDYLTDIAQEALIDDGDDSDSDEQSTDSYDENSTSDSEDEAQLSSSEARVNEYYSRNTLFYPYKRRRIISPHNSDDDSDSSLNLDASIKSDNAEESENDSENNSENASTYSFSNK